MNNDAQHENLPLRKADTISTPYTDQFEAWLKKKREEGLRYINIYYGKGLNKNTVNYESFCEEFMKMQNAKDVPDPEVIGKYSLPKGF